jgi:hypothetical protein
MDEVLEIRMQYIVIVYVVWLVASLAPQSTF